MGITGFFRIFRKKSSADNNNSDKRGASPVKKRNTDPWKTPTYTDLPYIGGKRYKIPKDFPVNYVDPDLGCSIQGVQNVVKKINKKLGNNRIKLEITFAQDTWMDDRKCAICYIKNNQDKRVGELILKEKDGNLELTQRNIEPNEQRKGYGTIAGVIAFYLAKKAEKNLEHSISGGEEFHSSFLQKVLKKVNPLYKDPDLLHYARLIHDHQNIKNLEELISMVYIK
jgi:hypothetical protein